jgi:hypothetical protein
MALTALEEKILVALAQNVGEKRISTEEIARQVECRPETIYKRLNDNPEFRQAFQDTLKNSMLAEAPAIVKSLVDVAKQGSFKHTKLFFEMIGMHQDKQEISANVSVDTETPFKDDAQREAFLRATLQDVARKVQSSD